MTTIYQYPKCGTCRKAMKWIGENSLEMNVKDITLETPGEEELVDIILRSGLPVSKFFNTSGKIYREMNLKERVKTISAEEAAKLLSENGMLIKRPLLVNGDEVMVGFRESDYEAALIK